MLLRCHFVVAGRVQGVGFREAARTTATSLHVTGWVRNLPDGRVEGIAEGDEDALRKFQAFLRTGPRLSRVDHVEIVDAPATGELSDFIIRRER